MEWVVLGVMILLGSVPLLWKLRGRPKDESRALLDPELVAVLRASRTDHAALSGFFAHVAADPAARAFAVHVLGRTVRAGVLETWRLAEPDSPWACMVSGVALIERAWKIRGYGKGSEVSSEAAADFVMVLHEAGAVLERAAELAPDSAIPWAWLITVAKGLGEPETGALHFAEARRRDPQSWFAHAAMLSLRCEKWSGSHDAMFELAHEAARSAGPHSDLQMLIAVAHTERALFPRWIEQDPEGTRAYLAREDAREEVLHAYERSLGAPDHVACATTPYARHAAALWFFLVEDREPLRRELLALGPRIDPDSLFARLTGGGRLARRLAGL